MKDFQEFCNSLDQEFIDAIVSDTSYVFGANAPIPNSIMGNSFAVAMRVLERYHEWLHAE